MKFDLVGEKRKKDSKITFGGNKNIKNNTVNLSRRNADFNNFLVAAPTNEDSVIRISPLISLDKMKKESSDNALLKTFWKKNTLRLNFFHQF